MESIRQIVLHDPLRLVMPLCLLVGTVIAGYLVKRLLFRALQRWGAKTSTQVDTVMIRSLRRPIIIWSLILGIYFATESLDLTDRSTQLIERTLVILTIVSLTLMTSRLAGNLIRHYGTRVQGVMPVTRSGVAAPVAIAAGEKWKVLKAPPRDTLSTQVASAAPPSV